MTRKSILKTINLILAQNNMEWFLENQLQSANEAQTCETIWFFQDLDYRTDAFQYMDPSPCFINDLTKEELMQILHLLTTDENIRGKWIVSIKTDTFGEYADVEYLEVRGMIQKECAMYMAQQALENPEDYGLI